jgi:hypothetical protein
MISKLSSSIDPSGEFVVLDEINVIENEDDDAAATAAKKRKEPNLLDGITAADPAEVVISSEDKENMKKRLKQMTRKELEDLVLVKVVEAVVQHSEAGKLRTKVLDLQTHKDKMFQRVGHLQKQVRLCVSKLEDFGSLSLNATVFCDIFWIRFRGNLRDVACSMSYDEDDYSTVYLIGLRNESSFEVTCG